MPNYKGHLVGGFAAYALFLFFFIGIAKPSLFVAGEWLIFTLAGALFPDIDIKSKGQKYFYFSVFLFFIVLASYQHFEMVTCCSFIAMVPMLVRHRGVFHSPLFVIITPLIIWMIVSSINPAKTDHFFLDSFFFIIGALSHIWLDLGTSQMMRRLFIKNKKRW
jgi:membrane-bound metal-dependent hydrolase YbcI (DUF457 family)